MISIHAPREGGDSILCSFVSFQKNFNPRPPRGGRPRFPFRPCSRWNFNPRPPRGGRLQIMLPVVAPLRISIHAPREGGDHTAQAGRKYLYHNFNPRPPRGGRRAVRLACALSGLFQSTPPVRGATGSFPSAYPKCKISIHAPREGGDLAGDGVGGTACLFQSTPPARGATVGVRVGIGKQLFQSTPPARGATPMVSALSVASLISIHAPREGGDRHSPPEAQLPDWRFQSTPPARGATSRSPSWTRWHQFQSTPPARGATVSPATASTALTFQSTPPARGATAAIVIVWLIINISIHAPREGGDPADRATSSQAGNFNPRPPRGGRQQRCTVLPADL